LKSVEVHVIENFKSLHGNRYINMRVITTPAFSKFLVDNSTIYPYSKLRPTRNSFYCKWVMLEGQDRGSTEYYPVLANSIPNVVLCELISIGRAKPLTPDLTDVMDAMYWWGKNKNIDWYDDVIVMVDEALHTEYDRKELFRALISGQVKVEIHEYFGVNSFVAELLWLNWISWYNASYRYGPKSFLALSLYCFDYIKWAIAQVNHQAFPPLHVIDSGPESVSSN
jgi:hypothetical protein